MGKVRCLACNNTLIGHDVMKTRMTLKKITETVTKISDKISVILAELNKMDEQNGKNEK